VGHGLPIIEALLSNSDTPHSVGLLWASDQPDAEISDSTQHSKEAFMFPAGFKYIIPASERS